MKSSYFISVLIAVALCFGQLASNTHALSHLSMPLLPGDHAEMGHKHHTQQVLVAKVADESGSEKFDCAIYHTFAGSNGLITVQSDDFPAQFGCVIAAAIPSLPIPAGISASPHIRGPPQLS